MSQVPNYTSPFFMEKVDPTDEKIMVTLLRSEKAVTLKYGEGNKSIVCFRILMSKKGTGTGLCHHFWVGAEPPSEKVESFIHSILKRALDYTNPLT